MEDTIAVKTSLSYVCTCFYTLPHQHGILIYSRTKKETKQHPINCNYQIVQEINGNINSSGKCAFIQFIVKIWLRLSSSQ